VTAPPHTLLLTEPAGALADIAVRAAGYEVVTDLDRCLARLRAGDPPVTLVAIDPAWPRPIAAVHRLRGLEAPPALALVVPDAEVASSRSTLAFLPEVGEVAVIPAGAGGADLHRRLSEVTSSSRHRQQLRGALDAINRDLADRRNPAAEDASSTVSEHYLAALVRHAADTIISLDPGGRIVTINAAAQRSWGVRAEEVEGRPVRELLADEDGGELLELLAAAGSGQEQVDHELALHLRDGRQLLLSATAAAIRDDADALAGLVLIARDVTNERRSEQRLRALQKAESLATLASGVAHDFNNLLVQVQGWADLARGSPDDPDLVGTALEHIGVATRQASELARAMLAYGGRGRFEPEPLRLATLVTGLRPLLAATVPAKVQLEFVTATDAEVRGDPTQLRQVVLNLVINAVEAIGDRPGAIVVRTGRETVGSDPTPTPVTAGHDGPPLLAGHYATIEVQDTGPGIDQEHHDRLFDPFFTTKFTGRGLGLAASQGIVRAHGGVITAARDTEAGARFRVHLPTS
jgi:two-component system, cell cycle sensor histidine kinase and response regulator CckA